MEYTGKDHTFVICAYKESPFLEKCIRSLLKQTVKSRLLITTSTNCEYISSIARKYRLELIVNNGRKSISDDWNYGYRNCFTSLVTLAHQDDIYMPDYLENMLKEINREKKPLIAFSDYGELRGKKVVYDSALLNIKRVLLFPLRFKMLRGSIFVRRRCLSFGSCICCPSVTFVKENLPDTIFKYGYKSNVDWQAWERISRFTGQFVYCKRPLVLHRIHPDSETTRIIGDRQRTKEDYGMFLKFWPPFIAKMINRLYSLGEKSNSLG